MRLTKTSFCLIFLSFGSALLGAEPWISNSHTCKTADGKFERHVELIYESPESAVPCSATFYRDVEHYKVPHLLFHAVREKGRCEVKRNAYLEKMRSWGVACRQTAPQPQHLSTSDQEKLRSPAALGLAESIETTAPLSSRPNLGTLSVKLQFSQSVININSNGKGSIASDSMNPGMQLNWNLPLNSRWSLVTLFMLEHMGFGINSSTDSFNSSAPWLWAAGVGSRYQLGQDFSFKAQAKLQRRVFIRRESASVLGADTGLIPEADLEAQYRLFDRKGGAAFLGAGAGYLFPAATQFSQAQKGVAYFGSIRWEESYRSVPFSLGVTLERTLQDSALAQHSTWTLGVLLGVQLESSEKRDTL